MSEWAGSEGKVSVTRNCSPSSAAPCSRATPNELVRKLHYLSLAIAGKNRVCVYAGACMLAVDKAVCVCCIASHGALTSVAATAKPLPLATARFAASPATLNGVAISGPRPSHMRVFKRSKVTAIFLLHFRPLLQLLPLPLVQLLLLLCLLLLPLLLHFNCMDAWAVRAINPAQVLCKNCEKGFLKSQLSYVISTPGETRSPRRVCALRETLKIGTQTLPKVKKNIGEEIVRETINNCCLKSLVFQKL